MHPAIYKIINKVNGDFYIGASLYPIQREAKHWNLLKLHKHPNYILQSAYNEYGAENFYHEIIKYCDQKDLQKEEQRLISELRPVYNIQRNSQYMYNKEFKESYTSKLYGQNSQSN